MLLPTRLINITGEYLYPAYATYKSLGRRPADHAELERWLMYWSLVGAWTAVEGILGWFLEWIPLYTIGKTVLFLYLASASNRATPYLYNEVLAPLFTEHEPEIDAFLANIRGRAGDGARGGLGWLWDTIRKALGLTQDQATQLSNAAGVPGYRPGSATAGAQPPTLADPASGAVQQAYGLVSGLASKYLPGALAAMTAAAQSASTSAGGPGSSGSSARGFDVPASASGPPAPVAPAGSRSFQYTSEEVFVTSLRASDSHAQSRTGSDGSLSGSASGSNLAASGFAEIRREEAEGADDMPAHRRTSSNWMRWSSPPKDKAE